MKKYKEYKDETPERTINLIRSILTDLDLLLLDSNANCDNIFACRVILGNHDLAKLGIGMNGKGSTFEYALASGYAEFMEKIQNRFLCDYIHTFYGTKEFVNTLPPDSMYKKKIHKENVALDFRYDEREEYWTLEKVLTSFGSELMLLYHANNIEELKSILIDVIKIEENHILMIPCFSKRDNDEVFVPIDLILHAIKKYDVNINHLIETNLKLMEKINLINNECNNIEDYISEVNISNLLNNLSSLNIYNLCTLAPCGAGHTMLGFDIDGSFYSCDYFIGNLEFKIGNIYEVDDIKNSIFRNPSVQNLLKRNIDSIKECRMCTWKNVCTYHCASDSYFNHKTLYKPHSMCEYVKKIIPRIIDLLYRKKISINNIPPC